MRRGRGAPGGQVTTRGGHGLVNEGESAQAQALLVKDLHDGGNVRATHADVRGDQVRERLEARTRAQVVILGLRVKMCVWLGVSRGLDLAFLNAD